MEYSLYLGLAKECIDAMLPYEKYGRWGGDGFSKYDLAYNVAGIGLGVLIDKIWKPKNKIKEPQNKSKTVPVLLSWFLV